MAKKTEAEREAESDELALALGKYVINWSMVANFELFIAIEICGLDGHAAAALSKTVREQQRDEFLLSAAPSIADESDRDALVAWVKRVKVARRERAQFLHDAHGYEHSGGDWVRSLLRFGLKEGKSTYGLIATPVTAHDVRRANATLASILGDYEALPSAMNPRR